MPKGIKIENMVYKLFKVFYSLKHSPRFWYKRLSSSLLEKISFSQIYIDHNILITKTRINRPIVSIFVNDIKIIEVKKSGMTTRIKQKLTSVFLIVDIGSISFYLGLKMERNCKQKTLKLFQPAYIDKVL